MGQILNLDALRKELDSSNRNLEALKKGLEDERQKRSEHMAHLATAEAVARSGGTEETFDPAVLRREIVSIDANIKAISGVLDGEYERRGNVLADIAAAEAILKAHGQGGGGNGIPK